MPDSRNRAVAGCFEHPAIRKTMRQILSCCDSSKIIDISKARLVHAVCMCNYTGPPQAVRWVITSLIHS